MNNKQFVLSKVLDAECVRDERTGKFYIREAEEQHHMSAKFNNAEDAWADAVRFVNDWL